MLNNIYPLVLVTSFLAPAQSPVVTPFGAAAAWVVDEAMLLVQGY